MTCCRASIVSLCVTDTGTGMTPDVIARAFDPFFTTKPMGQGTGLGLSMVYGFVRQSGGQVRIYSEVGNGTTMCLYLPRPLRQRGRRRHRRRARFICGRGRRGETVLVVDDEPSVRMLVTEVLEELGYVSARRLPMARRELKMLRVGHARSICSITDVGLPGGINGRQLADAARPLRAGSPGPVHHRLRRERHYRQPAISPNMGVLTKPFVMETLARRIIEMTGDEG